MVNMQDSARDTRNLTYSNKYFFTNCPKCNILIDWLYLAGFSQISSQMLWVLEQGTVNKFNILILYRCVLGTFAMHVFFTIHVLPYMFYIALPYMFYYTRFQRLQTGIGTVRGSNYPLAVLCQDLGLFILLAAVLWIEEGGADEVDHFRLSGLPGLSTMPGWYKACGIGKSEQQVHLQPLCCIWSSGCSFGFCIPVSSL